MPAQTVAGFPVYWQEMGSGTQPGLLIHCSLAQSGVWGRMMGHLDGLITAKAFDLPGHGRSGDWVEKADFQTISCAIAAALLSGPAHIIGHSFGATIALRLAVEKPELLESLTLIEPVYFAATKGTPAFTQYLADFAPFVAAIKSGELSRAAAAFTAIWGTGVSWQDMSENQKSDVTGRIHMIAAGNSAIFEDAAGVLSDGRLEKLNMPVLLLQGNESPPVISAILDVLDQRIPNTKRAVIAGAAHMAPVTHAKAVAEQISAFLRRNDQP